jgi:hypothetical protein
VVSPQRRAGGDGPVRLPAALRVLGHRFNRFRFITASAATSGCDTSSPK